MIHGPPAQCVHYHQTRHSHHPHSVNHGVERFFSWEGFDNLLIVPLRSSRLVEHEFYDETESCWVETHEDEEVHDDSDDSVGCQLFQSGIMSKPTKSDQQYLTHSLEGTDRSQLGHPHGHIAGIRL